MEWLEHDIIMNMCCNGWAIHASCVAQANTSTHAMCSHIGLGELMIHHENGLLRPTSPQTCKVLMHS